MDTPWPGFLVCSSSFALGGASLRVASASPHTSKHREDEAVKKTQERFQRTSVFGEKGRIDEGQA